MGFSLDDAERRDVLTRVSRLVSEGVSLTQACKEVAQAFTDSGRTVSGRTIQRYVSPDLAGQAQVTQADKAHRARLGIGIDALQGRIHRLMTLHEKQVVRLEQQQTDSERDPASAPPSDVAIKRAVDTAAALVRAEAELFERGARLTPEPPTEGQQPGQKPAKDIVDLAAERLRKAQEGSG